MTEYTVSGVAHDPDTDAPLTGLWRVRIYEPIQGVHPDELIAEMRQDVAAYQSGGQSVSITLPETTGSQLYWAVFHSDDRETTIGPLLFTLTADRTWDDIIANPSPVPSGGGEGVSDGVGSVFFGGYEITIPLTRGFNPIFCPFIHTDDPPRAPIREDLFVVDPEDDTRINVVKSGLYDISMNTPLGLQELSYEPDSNLVVVGEAFFSVNDGSEPPIYDYNNRAFWNGLVEGVQRTAPVTLNLTFPQVLLAGDVCRLQFRAIVEGLGDFAGGEMTMYPDLTMVMTYRGAPPPGLE